jgi:hypothetical protein
MTKSPGQKWSGLLFTFRFGTMRFAPLPQAGVLSLLLTLTDNAFTVTAAISKQVECVWREAGFVLRNRRSFALCHIGYPAK